MFIIPIDVGPGYCFLSPFLKYDMGASDLIQQNIGMGMAIHDLREAGPYGIHADAER